MANKSQRPTMRFIEAKPEAITVPPQAAGLQLTKTILIAVPLV